MRRLFLPRERPANAEIRRQAQPAASRASRIAEMANPYESPRSAENTSQGRRTVLFRVVAVACWILALLPVLGFLSIVGRVDVAEKFKANPVLAVTVTMVGFGLPVLGLALLGLGSWRRSGWLALAGVLPFVAIISWFLAVLLFRFR